MIALSPGKKAELDSVEQLHIDQKTSYLVSRQTGLTTSYSETIESSAPGEQVKRVATLELQP